MWGLEVGNERAVESFAAFRIEDRLKCDAISLRRLEALMAHLEMNRSTVVRMALRCLSEREEVEPQVKGEAGRDVS